MSTFPPTDRHYPYGFGGSGYVLEQLKSDVAKVTEQAELEKKKVLATQVAKYFGIEVRNVGVVGDKVVIRTPQDVMYTVAIGREGRTPVVAITELVSVNSVFVSGLIKQGFWT